MNVFDAIGHSFSALSTGGYSTHDASIGYFDSPAVEAVATIFALIGAISFNEHFFAWRTLQLQRYGRDAQTRAFLVTVAALIVVTVLVLHFTHTYATFGQALRLGVFEVVTVITSTGLSVADFSVWPLALPVLLMFATFVGGCAGSSAGGIKVIRFVVLGKQAGVHIHKLIHPQGVRRIKVDSQVVPDAVVESVGGFFAVYISTFAAFMMLVMMDGMDQVTAFGAVASSINNVGPGLGAVASNFLTASAHTKVVLAFAMLIGRLEIFTFLVLLTPAFWRR
jgi:trk system potassium uptake protein TrkH